MLVASSHADAKSRTVNERRARASGLAAVNSSSATCAMREHLGFSVPTAVRGHARQCPRPHAVTCRRPRVVAVAASRPFDDASDRKQTAGAEAQAASPGVPGPGSQGNGPRWETIGKCDVLMPAPSEGQLSPPAVIHFAGGLIAGTTPKLFYRELLEQLVERGGFCIVASRTSTTFDHKKQAESIAEDSAEVVETLRTRWNRSWIPVIGLGHSFGSKLHVMANSYPMTRAALGPRIGNILLAYNNYSAVQSIPLWTQLRDLASRGSSGLPPEVASLLKRVEAFRAATASSTGFDVATILDGPFGNVAKKWATVASDVVKDFGAGAALGDFTPSPDEVRNMAGSDYGVNRNLVVTYNNDTLDCADEIVPIIRSRFGDNAALTRVLSGTHITPLTPGGLGDADGMRKTGVAEVDSRVEAAAKTSAADLEATVTVIVAFARLCLEALNSPSRTLEQGD